MIFSASRSVRRVPSYALAVFLLLPSCSDASQTNGDDPATGERPPPLEIPFVSGENCPPAVDPSLPKGTGCVTSVRKEGEMLTVYARLDEGSPISWRVRLRSAEGEIDQRLDAGNSYPRAIEASDVDRDGRLEWWIRVMSFAGHGAPWARLNLFFVQDAALVPLSYEGEPLGINHGGISRLGEGAECRDGRLVLLRAEAENTANTRWSVSERTFEVEGGRARFRERTESVLRIEDYNDPALDRFFSVRCDGAVITPFS